MLLDRIREYLDYKGISNAAFEKSVGMSNASFSKPLKDGGAIGTDKLEKILLTYPEISTEWLFSGKGDMLKSKTYDVSMEVTQIQHPRSEEMKEDMQVVFLYDFEASAGLRCLFDNGKQNIIDTIRIPRLPKCDGAIYIVGDSMYPLLKSGDIILYKQVAPGIENVIYGEMYLISYEIDGDYYVVVKYIRKSGRGEPFVSLCSENPDHAPQDVDFRRINALAIVKASVRINSMV